MLIKETIQCLPTHGVFTSWFKQKLMLIPLKFHHLPKVINSLSLEIQNNLILPYASYKKAGYLHSEGKVLQKQSSSNTLVGFSWNLCLPRHFLFPFQKGESNSYENFTTNVNFFHVALLTMTKFHTLSTGM